jgi:beta-lactamase superfamily II metal-dependent hydrolase
VRRYLLPGVQPVEWIGTVIVWALAVLVAWHPIAPALYRGKLEVSVLDVGQGDSIFVAFPDGRLMLVDGGGQAGAVIVGATGRGRTWARKWRRRICGRGELRDWMWWR